jgi:hypothetical protein
MALTRQSAEPEPRRARARPVATSNHVAPVRFRAHDALYAAVRGPSVTRWSRAALVSNRHALLHLQRAFGNRYVGQVIERMRAHNAHTLVQRQGGGAAPACPTAVTFNFTQPAHAPHCGGPAVRATTNVTGVTWSLTAGTAAVDPASTITSNGTITLAATQAAGTINAEATASAPAAGGCSFTLPFTIASHPVGIASTSFVAAAAAGNYGGTFDHVFDSADGNVASLHNVGVGERFTNVPNPAGATHNIVGPLNPFGGTFTLNTATLTPGATNNWFLTAAGGLGGTLDSVATGQANINVGRFV